MAYENQIKCTNCGIPIPPMPEDATIDELMCDFCCGEYETMTNPESSVIKTLILQLLATQKRCPLSQFCEEVQIKQCMKRNEVLPVVIDAVSALQQSGAIRVTQDYAIGDMINCLWELNPDDYKSNFTGRVSII